MIYFYNILIDQAETGLPFPVPYSNFNELGALCTENKLDFFYRIYVKMFKNSQIKSLTAIDL